MAKTYYTVPDKAAGDTFTEAMWDNYIKTNINNLRVPPACDASTTATMSLSSGVQDSLNLAAESYDTDSMYTPGNDYVTIQTAGVYFINVQATLTADTTFELYVVSSSAGTICYSRTVSGTFCTANALQYLTASSTLTPYIKATSGGATVNTPAWLHVHWLGQTS